MASLREESSCSKIGFTRRFLFNKISSCNQSKIKLKAEFLKKYLKTQTNCPKENISKLNDKVSYFIYDFKKRWASSNRQRKRFLERNCAWLDGQLHFDNYKSSLNKRGRPSVIFQSASERTKRSKTQSLRSSYNTAELSYAAQMSLRSAGATDAILKEVISSPKRAFRYKAAYKKVSQNPSLQLSPEEALSAFVEAQLTREQYNIIRSKDKERFPSYKIVQKAKKFCYPEREAISITEVSAEIKLQGLLDHTGSRILRMQEEVLEKERNICSLHLLCKWGFDGSSGHSEHKQKFASDGACDASIFMSSLVPLRLISGNPEGPATEQIVIWSNPRSSSTRFCRPIKFQFIHESVDVAKQEREHIEAQIQNLDPLIYKMNHRQIFVYYKLLFTMVVGKICNALTDTTSTLKCYICGLSSKSFNNIKLCLKAKVKESSLQFGMSTLHAWIRFFECLLKLSYKLPLKKWQARGKDSKNIVKQTREAICQQFYTELGLVIDKPKPGYGSSNDGNTARRFFEHAETSSRITGVDIHIILRFRTILKSISSGFSINLQKFTVYALDTAKMFVEKYPWYPMPPTIHKVLIHGPIIIEKALLPIGQLSEEAQEANNKMFKRYREQFSRKISREKTNADILNRLLISSDPLITNMHNPQKKKTKLDPSVLALLECAEIHTTGNSSVLSSSDEDETENED